jgi:DNA repair exonuclease SbcCD ATPase subunit
VKITEKDAISRVTLLERRLEEREREMEVLLNSSQEQRAKTVEGFESLLASERAAKAEANQRAESLSLQIQTLRGELDVLQAQLATARNHDSALETRVRTFGETHTPPGYQTPVNPARNKRPYQEAGDFPLLPICLTSQGFKAAESVVARPRSLFEHIVVASV